MKTRRQEGIKTGIKEKMKTEKQEYRNTVKTGRQEDRKTGCQNSLWKIKYGL